MITFHDPYAASFNDPTWYFLAEYPLCDLLVDMDLRDRLEAGMLYQAVKVIGVPPALLDVIEGKLMEFATQAVTQLNQRRFAAPTTVRLYYQKKTPADIGFIQPASLYKAELTTKPAQIIRHSRLEINAGWGYFLVERGGGSQLDSRGSEGNWVGLYLYREGE